MNRLAGLSACELSLLLERREISAVQVLHDHLDRVDRLDGTIRALLRVNPEAEEEAREADRRLDGGEVGPLCGIPIVLKDNLATAGLATTCASRILEEFLPVRDATAVSRVREAGAVVVGKANMDEFGMGSSTENSAFGPTRNPWNPELVPGGSSGGSAAAVAARFAPLSLGSDTGGSVRQPASFCGVVGLKPTYGRVSRSGLVAYASSLEQIGPITGTVRDSAALLGVIAGSDPDDATCRARPVDDYESACEDGVAGLRICLPREYFEEGLDDEVRRIVLQAATVLENEGAIVEEASLPNARYAIPAYYLVATAEASSNLARYDGVRFGKRAETGGGLDRMYRATRGGHLGAEVRRRILLGTFALSAGYFEAFYGKAQRVRTLLKEDFARLFEAGVDLVLSPTCPTTAFRLGEKLDDPLSMYLSDIYTVTANLAGLPAISVPAGLSAEGLPVGAQIIGREFEEATILRAASVLEESLGRLDPKEGAS
jgi:aspartyl-tRNA(Asn)/glutamyl-tRNA(Gln) amidotransferase subunit A